MKTKNIKTKPNRNIEIDYEYYKEIPIMDICELLGIEVGANDFFICPAHDDNNPSAHINKIKNRWRCYSCGAWGSNLDLVKYVIGCKNLYEAALFLSNYYPDGIKKISQEQKKDKYAPPYITPQLLKEINLKHNPYLSVSAKKIVNISDNGKPVYKQENIYIGRRDATELLIDKITERQASLTNFARDIFAYFPELDNKAKTYIIHLTQERIEALAAWNDTLNKYSIMLTKEIEPSFQKEIEEEIEKEKF